MADPHRACPACRVVYPLRDTILDLLLERVAERAAGDGQRNRHRHAAAVDHDVPHHVELGDGTLQLGVDYLLERFENRITVGRHTAAHGSNMRL